MPIQAEDGTWVSCVRVTRFDCDVCGKGFYTSTWPMSDREIELYFAQHVREKHDGIKSRR